MEIVFDKPKLTAGKISGGKAKMPKHNMALKKAIKQLLKEHKIKNINKHVKHMEGSGLFDTLINIGKKTIEYGKKAYDVYDKNKESIHKGLEIGKQLYDKVKGGELNQKAKKWNERVMEYRQKHGCSLKQAMMALKKK